MIILNNLACVWADQMDMRACLLRMLQKGFKPSFVLLYRKRGARNTLKGLLPESFIYLYRKIKMSISPEDIRYSRSLFGENIFRGKFTKILTDYCIPFEILEINNINESAGVKAISSLKQKYSFFVSRLTTFKNLLSLKKRGDHGWKSN